MVREFVMCVMVVTWLGLVDLWQNDAPAKTLNGTKYEVCCAAAFMAPTTGFQEFMFLDAITNVLDKQDPNDPMFLFFASQLVANVADVRSDVITALRTSRIKCRRRSSTSSTS